MSLDGIKAGDRVIDLGGQNGVGVVVEVQGPYVVADWMSPRFGLDEDGNPRVIRGPIGLRWVALVR